MLRSVLFVSLVAVAGCTSDSPGKDVVPASTPESAADVESETVSLPPATEGGSEFRVPILGGRAEVVFPTKGLEFTASQLQAGVDLRYSIEIKEPLRGIRTKSLLSAPSDPEGPCDLLPLASVVGGEQSYCVWDFGKGPDVDPEPRDVPAGKRDHVLRWTGRNWGGPSCTGEEPGQAFPPGTYAFKVRLMGQLGEPYVVECSVPLVITP